MTEQKPSVGRVVHYVSYGTPGGEYDSQCRAAIITEVAADGHRLLTEPDGRQHSSDEVVVGLAVLNPSGMFFKRGAYDDGSETPGDPDCPEPHGQPFRYCPRKGCGWVEATLRGGTWHWPERV